MADDPPILLRCFDSFDAARAHAAGQLDAPVQPGPFDRLDWFEALHGRAFPGEQPLILSARRGAASVWLFLTQDEDGALCGIANWYSFRFRPQFTGGGDAATRQALLEALARDLRHRGARLRFYPVVDESEAGSALFADAFRAAGWMVIPRVLAHKRLIRLTPGTPFADYWAARPGPLRSTLKRKAQRHRLDIAIHRSVDDALWAALEAVFRSSWKPEGDDFAFLRAFAQSEAQAGRLRLGLALLRGAPAAVELWTVERDRAYIHKLAFDERFADASPGTQLSHAMFAHAIDTDKVTSIDFGTGDNEYKASWMPEALPMRQIDMFDLRRPASWRPALATRISALSQPDGRAVAKKGGGRKAALAAR